jgi:hypothetical protein
MAHDPQTTVRAPATRIYLAATTDSDLPVPLSLKLYPRRGPVRMLISYHFWKGKKDLDKILRHVRDELSDGSLEVFSDSGAFSAFTLGASISNAEYIEWVKRWKHWFTVVGALDVIGSAPGTYANACEMREAIPDIRVLPAFHVGEPWEWLERYGREFPDMALGGMVPYAGSRRRILDAWVGKALGLIPKTTYVHGFGLTSWDLLKKHAFNSVDSSSWSAPGRFATLPLFDSRRGAWDNFSYRKGDLRDAIEHRDLLAQYSITIKMMQAEGRKLYVLTHSACIEAWRRAETWLHDYRMRRGDAR